MLWIIYNAISSIIYQLMNNLWWNRSKLQNELTHLLDLKRKLLSASSSCSLTSKLFCDFGIWCSGVNILLVCAIVFKLSLGGTKPSSSSILTKISSAEIFSFVFSLWFLLLFQLAGHPVTLRFCQFALSIGI